MNLRIFTSKAGFKYKRNLFRRDVETAFYTGKPFRLPPIQRLTKEEAVSFRQNYPFNFVSSGKEFSEAGKILRSLENLSDIISQADKSLLTFNFPCLGEISLADQIKWNTSFSGYEWPDELTWKCTLPKNDENLYLLGRLNQLIFLGKAYLATSDKKYYNFWKYLLNNFHDENVFCTGVNWYITREVAIRLLNIIFSIPFFNFLDEDDPEFYNQIREYILYHALYIENNLQHEDRGYGYFISIAALAAAGVVLKGTNFGEKLLRLSYSHSEQMIRKYVNAEGFSNVRSLMYHPHITEAFLVIKKSFEKSPIKLSSLFTERFHKMFDALASMIDEDKKIPRIGDSFIQRILPLSNDKNLKYCFPLAAGVIETGKGIFKDFVPEPATDVLFYYGIPGVDKYKHTDIISYHKISRGFPDSGIFILRNEDIYVAVDASDISGGRRKTHGHIDVLSFELYYKNIPVLSDPGSRSYYENPSEDILIRSAKSHNTIYIDDLEPAEIESTFRIKEDLTNPKITEWHSDEYSDVLSIQHYAYIKFPDPVVIKRIFRFMKEKNTLVIRDEFFGGSLHKAAWNFIFHPSVVIKRDENDRFRITGPVQADIVISSSIGFINSTIQEQVFCSEDDTIENTRKISMNISAQFPLYVTTEIIFK